MTKVEHQDQDNPKFVEYDPTGRYGRLNEILGKGSSKIVYRAFDEYEGIEVAWNQVKLNGFLQSPQDMERLYCEIHLLKTLKHKHIMKFYTSWVDIPNRNINFVTELFISGTLRQYRQKYKRVQIRAVKHWCRQILKGLLYLHSYNPPIIHRDLKCDNIFINGNQGVVKIGDLGLAAILRKSHAARCVGTPEFMAPEVYEEEYNELVDIYSFGMCVLEMVTSEYPYSECTHPAQIYLKVISGTKPEALSRIEDPEVRQFVEKCLVKASRRLSARELLNDPFLRNDDHGLGSWEGDIRQMCHILGQPPYQVWDNTSYIANKFDDDKLQQEIKMENAPVYSDSEKSHILLQPSDILLHQNGSSISSEIAYDLNHEAVGKKGLNYIAQDPSTVQEPSKTVDNAIKGTRGEDGSIFLKLRITDKEGRIRHVHFPFDIKIDTAFDVATEMVDELEIADYGATKIANMINGEVYSLIPEWKPSLSKAVPSLHTTFGDNCPSNVSSNVSLLDLLSIDTSGYTYLQSRDCFGIDFPDTDGQFEHTTYQLEGSERSLTNEASLISTIDPEVLDISYHASRGSHSDEEGDRCHGPDNNQKESHPNHTDNKMHIDTRECVHKLHSDSIKHSSVESSKSRFYCPSEISDSYENKLNQELKRLKSENQMEQKDSQQQLVGKIQNPPPEFDDQRDFDGDAVSSTKAPGEKCKPFQFAKRFSFRTAPRRDLLKTSGRLSDIDRGCSSNPDSGARSNRFCEWPRSQFVEVNLGIGIDNMFPSKRNLGGGFHLPNSLL